MEKSQLKEIILEQISIIKNKDAGIIRDCLPDIGKFLKLPHCVVIAGLRRVGKSTLLLQLMQNMESNDFYYFNFEDERLINFTTDDFNSLFEILVELYGEKKIFFLDEIQNVAGWEIFVRRMMDKGYKFIITGSNASLLSKESGTKLTGRYVFMILYPFSFSEFLTFKGFIIKKDDLSITEKRAMIKKLFSEYLKDGGMPEYLKYQYAEILKSLYDDILYRDISARYQIRDVRSLRELALYYLSNISGYISYNKLKNMFMLGSVNTIKSYTEYLENSFLIFTINIFSYSLKQQVIAPKKVYCLDNGIANAISFGFSKNSGKYLENFVFIELKRRNKEMYYYKTKNNLEVDFVIKKGAKIDEAIQVTYEIDSESIRNREINSLKQAMSELSLDKGLILTYDHEEKITFENNEINILPVYKWLLENKY